MFPTNIFITIDFNEKVFHVSGGTVHDARCSWERPAPQSELHGI